MKKQLWWTTSALLVAAIFIYIAIYAMQSSTLVKYHQNLTTYNLKEFFSNFKVPQIVPASITEPGLVDIAVLVPATTRKIKSPSLKNLSLTKICIPSIIATAEPNYHYKIYIGTEGYDYLATQLDALRNMSADNVQIIPLVVEGGTENKVINAIALQAYKDGVMYMSRINDDTKFITKHWTSLGIQTLRNYKPTNVGVVGPTCEQGNTAIMTHDMVHRTHMDIFKYYYPPVFENWYLDNWITFVYQPDRSTKLTNWEVVHTMEQGTRYEVDETKSKWTKILVTLGKVAIDSFIKKSSSHQTLRVIAYSLFGSEPSFTNGAIENAKLASKIYPGWAVRVYHDMTVPRYVLDKLRQENVQLIELIYSPLEPKTDWNLLVAFDPSIDRYIIRNIDSRLTWRERAAVDQWIESGKRFHIMRDHPFHSNNIVPIGLWGATHDAIPDIVTLIHTYDTNRPNYGTLQQFLNKEIWKFAKVSVIQHDSFSCEKYPGSVPFPTQRNGWEYVGSIYKDGKIRKKDFETLVNTDEAAKCI